MDKTELKETEARLSAYCGQVAKCAPAMKYSSLTCQCFLTKEPSEILAEKLDPSLAAVTEAPQNLRRTLYDVLGNSYTGRKVSRLLEDEIKMEFGRGCKVFVPEDMTAVCEALSGFSGGEGVFYIVEEVFFARFEYVTVMFYKGSDE